MSDLQQRVDELMAAGFLFGSAVIQARLELFPRRDKLCDRRTSGKDQWLTRFRATMQRKKAAKDDAVRSHQPLPPAPTRSSA